MLKNFISALFKKGKGFTLVELMVVMTIISVITAIILFNYRAGGRQLALDRSANKLAQDIRRAQEMTMSATECPAECPIGTGIPCPCTGEVPYRYGIYIASPLDGGGNHTRPDSYILFADDDDDGMFWNPFGDEEIEEIFFEKDVYLYNIDAPGCPLPAQTQHHKSHLTFKPPDPLTGLWVGHPPGAAPKVQCDDRVDLILGVEGSSQQRKVKVNKAGLIYVE